MGNFKPSKKKFHREGSERKFDKDVQPRFSDYRGNQHELTEAICAKCGKDFNLPFTPTGNRPVYCRDCFKRPADRNDDNSSSPNSNQLEQINKKLDMILDALRRNR